MAGVTVTVWKGQNPVAVQVFGSPITAETVRNSLRDMNAAYVGKLHAPNSSTHLGGQRVLDPGAEYFLDISEYSGHGEHQHVFHDNLTVTHTDKPSI